MKKKSLTRVEGPDVRVVRDDYRLRINPANSVALGRSPLSPDWQIYWRGTFLSTPWMESTMLETRQTGASTVIKESNLPGWAILIRLNLVLGAVSRTREFCGSRTFQDRVRIRTSLTTASFTVSSRKLEDTPQRVERG